MRVSKQRETRVVIDLLIKKKKRAFKRFFAARLLGLWYMYVVKKNKVKADHGCCVAIGQRSKVSGVSGQTHSKQ